MLIDTSVTIAYKCTSCGSFAFFNASLFTLLYKKNYSLSCHCKKSSISVRQEGENSFFVRIPCIGCDHEHVYMISGRSILLGKPLSISCPETGMQIFFIGTDEAVQKKVDSVEEELDNLIDTYGYESYFENTRVMFDTLNRIHDIALSKNLYCECDSTDIGLVLLPDCILLHCAKCGSRKIIPAAKNKDLKDILAISHIMIGTDVYFEPKEPIQG
ncbi:MAG: hypothetical protein GXY17_02890 [Clostridiaceae bacterium]|nr:hypothetical protein [Clostridiaceae bacterium]